MSQRFNPNRTRPEIEAVGSQPYTAPATPRRVSAAVRHFSVGFFEGKKSGDVCEGRKPDLCGRLVVGHNREAAGGRVQSLRKGYRGSNLLGCLALCEYQSPFHSSVHVRRKHVICVFQAG
ncbi:hypothetical protein OPV22_027620 [Ensete ventricosum]|uniref:Uncharacterized protein n=1 Tax=Ensete ventricosum TaxID=4639 RepID=A0AAV8PVV6_ENSVE|nr:hypothetical protein OPV22_027620 [Ensete ventricosum]